jgi:hypothetical protein
MKFRLYLTAMLAVILTGVVFTYQSMKPEFTASVTKSAAAARAEHSSGSPLRADAYVDYDYRIIEMTPGTKILFFNVPNGTQSRLLDKDIAASVIPEDTTIIKVDFDSNAELRKKYSVTIEATVVRVDDDGNMLNKYIAYDNPTFEAVKQHLLN